MGALEIPQALLRYITRDKNTLYVICPFNTGDVLINGGFCHALLKKKRKRSCVMIVRDRFATCGINFVGVSEVQCIPQILMNIICHYIYETGEYEADNYIYGHFQVGTFVDGKRDFIWNDALKFTDRYRVNVFHLPLDTELLPPLIDTITDAQKQRLHETYTLDKKRTIIFAPYSSSTDSLQETFWAELVAELARKKDYVFYTNVATPAEKVIPGTAPMTTTFPELTYLAENVNCFIGLRSGLFDLLAFTNARLLYVNKNISEWWHYDLNLNFNHANGRAFYVGISEQAYIRAFMEQNSVNSIDNLLLFDHVKGRDVAFDVESLLKKIVDSVD